MRYIQHSILTKALLSMMLVCALLFSNFSVVKAESIGDSLDVGMISTKTTQILPLTPTERSFMSIYALIYESLVTIDDNNAVAPGLAKSWTVSNGGKRIELVLRDNLAFSDGTPLTAYDVAASGTYLLTLANDESATDKGHYQNMTYLIDKIEAVDNKNVMVTTKRGYYSALYSLCFPVIPAGYINVPNPPGSGPYKIQSFSPAESIWLEPNEYWWQTIAQIKSISIQLYPNNNDLITDYEYGRIESAVTRSVAAAQYKSGISSLSIAYRTRQLEALYLNHRAYPLEDKAVRLAIRKAIDVATISSGAFIGMTYRAYSPFQTGTWMYEDFESSYNYDLEGAKRLLQESGWADTDDDGILDTINADGEKRNLVLRLYVYEDPENDVRFETANLIKEMLNSLKISVNITKMSLEDITSTDDNGESTTTLGQRSRLLAGSFDMALVSFQMDIAPDPGFMLISNNVKYGNYCRYNSTEMDELFNAYRSSDTQAKQANNAKEIQRLFEEDTPFIPLFYRSGAILTRRMFTTVRTLREECIFKGIESFSSQSSN